MSHTGRTLIVSSYESKKTVSGFTSELVETRFCLEEGDQVTLSPTGSIAVYNAKNELVRVIAAYAIREAEVIG